MVSATEPGQIRFPVRSRGASWGWSLPEDVELIGPMQATLWIEAHGTDDLDIFVGVEKWARGRYVPFEGSAPGRRRCLRVRRTPVREQLQK